MNGLSYLTVSGYVGIFKKVHPVFKDHPFGMDHGNLHNHQAPAPITQHPVGLYRFRRCIAIQVCQTLLGGKHCHAVAESGVSYLDGLLQMGKHTASGYNALYWCIVPGRSTMCKRKGHGLFVSGLC
jgi:hypothetical protein